MFRHKLSDLLYTKISRVEPYPDKVVPITKRLNITAFFPGGSGHWNEDESEMLPDILVLGQDFSNIIEYEKMLRSESTDLDTPTWRELIKLFKSAGIDLRRCFYSNVFMGLRNSKSMTGRFPGFKDEEFVRRNLDYLREQIRTVNPKLILTLGRPASEMISKLSDDLKSDWKDGRALSQAQNGLKSDIKIGNRSYTCVALEHSSMRNSNVKRRNYSNKGIEYIGNEAEIKMLKDAMEFVD